MTLSHSLPVLFLVACGGIKHVPVEALAEVSTASVVHLASLEGEVEDAQRLLADHENRYAEVSRAADSSDSALKSATSDLERSKGNRGVAVSDGDFVAAKALAEDVDTAESTVRRRSKRAQRQSVLSDLMSQGKKVREAELDAARARLEMARAQAASDGGADLKLQRYSRQDERFEKRLGRETSELRALEVTHGTELEAFAPAATMATDPDSQ